MVQTYDIPTKSDFDTIFDKKLESTVHELSSAYFEALRQKKVIKWDEENHQKMLIDKQIFKENKKAVKAEAQSLEKLRRKFADQIQRGREWCEEH